MRSIEQEGKIIKETKELVELFLQTNASDIELSKMTGISSSTVGRRLTNVANISKAFPDNGMKLYEQIKAKRQENLLHGKALGGQTTLLNHVYLQDENRRFEGVTKLRLDVLNQDSEKAYRMLMHAALTFRLHPDTLSTMFQIDEKILYENLLNINGNCYESLMFLFYHDARNQEKAREDFLAFYRDLLNAIRTRNIEEKRRVMRTISDSRAVDFKNKERSTNSRISDEEILSIIKYQIKYSLDLKSIERIFNITHSSYVPRVYKLLEHYPELRSMYEYLADFHKKNYAQKMGRKY